MNDTNDNNNGTVLLVTDQPVMLYNMECFLAPFRYTVEMERTLSEVVARAALVRSDLILIDAGLPMIRGYRICRALRDTLDTTDLPVVLYSLLPESDEMRQAGFEAGAVGYLDNLSDWGTFIEQVCTYLPLRNDLLFGSNPRDTGEVEIPDNLAAIPIRTLPPSAWTGHDWGLVEDIEDMLGVM